MNIYAISDLHISLFNNSSPMEKYGDVWKNHLNKVQRNWEDTVAPEDIVLLGGDTSLGNKLEDAKIDLNWLENLPGKKVLVKGNHDFWWSSLKKLRSAFPKDFHFIQNDVMLIDDIAIGGSRLWSFPFVAWNISSGNNESLAWKYPKDDQKIRNKELSRLRFSLSKMPTDAKIKIALVHYPPIDENGTENILTEIMSEFHIDLCVFGHLHNIQKPKFGSDCVIGNTRYVLSSCDWLECKLIKLYENV